MTLQDTLAQLRKVKRSADGYTALCPAHDDRRSSLSVTQTADGRLLLYCHAGCTFESILNALDARGQHKPSSASKAVASGYRADDEATAVYDYRDERGALLYQVLRFGDPKEFRPRSLSGKRGLPEAVRRVPYRLPELLASDGRATVFIVEGEKDADRLAGLGLVATTNVSGAGKWRVEYVEHLRARHVCILPDNDEAGAKHAAQVAASLHGSAASVRVVNLPGLPPKGDASDYLDAGGTTEELLRFASAAPEWTPTDAPRADGKREKEEAPALRVVRMADVQSEQVAWLWHPYIAKGKLTILEGDPGLGKSWLTCALAAAVSNGRGLPGAPVFESANVLMLSAEDGLGDTLRPRLDAVGANVSRVFALAEPLTLNDAGLMSLEAAVIEHAPALVIIDPLFAFTGGKVDIHRANECRAISAPLAALAERHGCALLAVRHLGKSRGGGHALNAGIGSIDFTAAARSVLLAGRDPEDANRCAVVQTKNNLAAHGGAIGYRLEDDRFMWTGASDLTAARILNVAGGDEDERAARSDAVTFLRGALALGTRPAKDVQAEARQAGFSEQQLRTARTRLRVRVYKEGGRFGGGAQRWMWELPEAEDVDGTAEGVKTENY